MPKFLIRASYTSEGLKGLMADRPARRMAAVKKAVAGLGGKVESFYWALGDDDVVLIVDMPDAESVAALTMTVAASGHGAEQPPPPAHRQGSGCRDRQNCRLPSAGQQSQIALEGVGAETQA